VGDPEALLERILQYMEPVLSALPPANPKTKRKKQLIKKVKVLPV
jgi:hypothetical protein